MCIRKSRTNINDNIFRLRFYRPDRLYIEGLTKFYMRETTSPRAVLKRNFYKYIQRFSLQCDLQTDFLIFQ